MEGRATLLGLLIPRRAARAVRRPVRVGAHVRELAAVGRELRARSHVLFALRGTCAQAQAADEEGRQNWFAAAARAVTDAVALALEERGPNAAGAREAAQGLLARLAERRCVPLDELVRSLLELRMTLSSEVTASARRLGVPEEVLSEALAAVHTCLDGGLLSACEGFERERRHAREELMFLATHDPLTGLANRELIARRISAGIARSRRGGEELSVLFVDLDNFKLVNDTLGHGAGDELLRHVTERLLQVAGDAEAVGRLGGDEFVIIGEGAQARDPVALAARVLHALRAPFVLAGGRARFTVTASIGVAATGTDSPEELLRSADVAMYRAKAEGKDRYNVISRIAAGALSIMQS